MGIVALAGIRKTCQDNYAEETVYDKNIERYCEPAELKNTGMQYLF
jgi:hypothetical protein